MTRLHLVSSYFASVVRHRIVVLVLVAAATVMLSIGAGRVFVEVDPQQQLPQAHPYVQSFHEVHRIFGDWNLVMIGLRPTHGSPFAPPFLGKVQEITRQIDALPGVVKPLLQSIASPNAKTIGHRDDVLLVSPLMPNLTDSREVAELLQARLLEDPTFWGTLVSFDRTTVAIYATFELTRELPGYVNLHHAIENALRRSQDGTFEYFLAGPVVMASALSRYAGQIAYLFPIALFLISLVHYDAFRTWQAVGLPILTGLLAVVWALGLMGYAGVPLDPLNSTTPVLILAVGAGHAVQVLKRYYELLVSGRDNQVAIIDAMSQIAPVMLAAGTIAMLSFFSLAMLGTDSMRTFGVFTGLGVASAVVIEMTLIPALRATLPALDLQDWRDQNTLFPKLDHHLRSIADRLSSVHFAKIVLTIYLMILIVFAGLAFRLQVDTSFKHNFSVTDRVRIDDNILNELFGGTNSLIFTFSGKHDGSITTPAAMRGIAQFQSRIEAIPGVGKTVSIVDTIARVHRVLTDGHEKVPSTAELISQYLFLYSLSGGDDLATRITADNRATKVVVMLREDSTRFGEKVIAEAMQIASEEFPEGVAISVAGSVASNAALTEVMVAGKALNIAQIALITITVSAVIFKSLLAGFLVAIPLAITAIINFGVMGLLNVPLDIATAAVTAMAVGIGADYAVYILFRLREEYRRTGHYQFALTVALATSGKAVLYVSTAIAIGYSVLCFSTFRMFVQLGALVSLAMLVSSVTSLLVLPAILTILVQAGWLERILGKVDSRTATETKGTLRHHA